MPLNAVFFSLGSDPQRQGWPTQRQRGAVALVQFLSRGGKRSSRAGCLVLVGLIFTGLYALGWLLESGRIPDTMVMTGGGGTDSFGDFIDRNVFHDIGPDRFSWRKDRSWDGGETWIEGVAVIEAVRVKDSG